MIPRHAPPTSGRPFLVVGALCALGLGGAFSPAAAQSRSLTWTQITTIEMPGTMGALLRASGSLGEQRSNHGLHLRGSLLREDDGSSSVVFDAEGRRFISMDHDTQTYMEFTFEESAQMAREMSEVLAESRADVDESLRESQAEMDAAMEEFRQNMDAMQESMTFRIETQATGERREIDGMTAERFLISATLEGAEDVEGMEDVEGGQVVFLVDVWQTPEFPDFDAFMEEWGREMATDPAVQELARDLSESVEPLAGDGSAEMLAMWDPRIAAGVQEVMEAMEELEGTPLESRTLVAVVEPGATLDREALLAWEPSSMGDQIRGQAGETARAAAQEAARGAVRGLTRGLLGRRGGDQAEEQQPPRVRPLLRVSSLRRDTLYSGDVQEARDLLAELSSYRAISLADLMREIPTGS